MAVKQTLIVFNLMLLLLIAVPASAAVFSDNFDDSTFTNANWSIMNLGADPSPVWNFVTISGSNFGYHTNTFSRSQEDTIPPTVNLANNGQIYETSNLSIQALIRIDNSGPYSGTCGVAGFYLSPAGNSQNGHGIFFQVDYEGSIEINLQFIERLSGSTNYSATIDLTGEIDYNIWYQLTVMIDALGFYNIYLDEVSSSDRLVNVENFEPSLKFSSGSVAIYSESETTFDNFVLTGNPQPQAMPWIPLLLLSD